MHELWDANAARWGDDAAFIAVNAIGSEDGIMYINVGTTIPVLQDVDEVGAFAGSGAAPFYVYVLDGDRNVVFAHYTLALDDVTGEGQRAVDEVDAVLAGEHR